MANSYAVELLLAGDYKSAKLYLKPEANPLEYAYACFLSGEFNVAISALELTDSIRANWLKELINLIRSSSMCSPTYFQIRNFLELDIDLFIKSQKINYMDCLLKASEKLNVINKETYKLIGRVLFNDNLLSLAKYYLDKYKNIVYYDPELHYIYAKYYIIKEDYKNALISIDHCLAALPEYFPAKLLKQTILGIIESKNFNKK